MKKKAYIVPLVTVVNIQRTTLLAGSVAGTSGADGLDVGEEWSSGSAN